MKKQNREIPVKIDKKDDITDNVLIDNKIIGQIITQSSEKFTARTYSKKVINNQSYDQCLQEILADFNLYN
ncbi:MAG: DUF2969 family protein [Firmicutes bacterium]|uniref:DUF2969 family protein n=1 Tax=Candidatus Gallilactobacillus intestinavium TaxID=2840838 RepID=A0A9D9E6G8_9LACO|nr:DUF2969 family protein [Candidatus Gallilactobacillus intestinavium]